MFARALVTGATGRLGAEVVPRLRQHARSVKIGARSLVRVAGFPAYGFDVSYLDFDLPASWEGALEGVQRLLLVPPPVDPFAAERIAPFVRRAAEMGVRRVVLVSHAGANHPAEAALGALEAEVQAAVPQWAVVRPSWFIQDLGPRGFLYPSVRDRRVLLAPTGEGRVPFVDARDVAEAVVRLLTAPRIQSQIYEAPGPHALSFEAVAALCTLVSGHAVRFVDVDPTTFHSQLVGAQWPVARVRLLGHRLAQIRSGAAERFSDDLDGLLGRPRQAVSTYLGELGPLLRPSPAA